MKIPSRLDSVFDVYSSILLFVGACSGMFFNYMFVEVHYPTASVWGVISMLSWVSLVVIRKAYLNELKKAVSA